MVKESKKVELNDVKLKKINSNIFRKPESGAVVIESLTVNYREYTYSHQKHFTVSGIALVGTQIGVGPEALICNAYTFEYNEDDMAYALDVNAVYKRIQHILAKVNDLYSGNMR